MGCAVIGLAVWFGFVMVITNALPLLKAAASPILCMPEGRSALVVTDTSYVMTNNGRSESIDSDLYCVDERRHAYRQPGLKLAGALFVESLIFPPIIVGVQRLRRRRRSKEVAS